MNILNSEDNLVKKQSLPNSPWRQTDIHELLGESEPEPKTKGIDLPAPIGSYVLGTHFSDGSPHDPWGVGIFTGVMTEYDPPRYILSADKGQPIRSNGFRKIGEISPEFGAFLLSRKYAFAPLTGLSLWDEWELSK